MADINSTIQQASETPIAKKIIFFSVVIINWLTGLFVNMGIPLTEIQLKVGMALIDVVVLYLVLAVMAKMKPIVKIILVLLFVWFLIGFFVPM
ncbi:MAG: hypothetical protein AABY22_20500 [Nanoarchaeota archaeon]